MEWGKILKFIAKNLGPLALRVLPIIWLRIGTTNPYLIKQTIYDRNKAKLTKLFEELDAAREQKNVEHDDSPTRYAEVKGYEEFFLLIAKYFWGRSTPRSCSISSQYYALAAECAEHRGDNASAAEIYHWAGHQFRDNGFLDVAMDYYMLSANQYKRAASSLAAGTSKKKRYENACGRSAKRAIGICTMVGEFKKAQLIADCYPEARNYDPSSETNPKIKDLMSTTIQFSSQLPVQSASSPP